MTDIEYDRKVLVDVLIYHWPTSTSGCGCGGIKLGDSFPEHVADVYEAVMQEKLKRLKTNLFEVTDTKEPQSLFSFPGVKAALWLLLGGGFDNDGKNKWLSMRLAEGMTEEAIFTDALSYINGQIAT